MNTYLVCYTLRVLVQTPDFDLVSAAMEVSDPEVKSNDGRVIIQSVDLEYEETLDIESDT